MASTSNSADIGIRVFLQDAASMALFAIDSNLGRLGQTAQKASMLFGNMSNQLVGMAVVAGLAASFVAFAGGIAYSVVQAQGLQQALTDISLATGLTSAQMAILTPFLFNLGATSIYSLQQLADGIAVVGQYGFKTTQQIELMAAAGVKLAEATGTTTVEAFKLLAVTMQAFNIPASQANETAALLFYSIEHGTPNVPNLTSALGQLGGVATELHVTLADIIPALDTVSVGMGSATTAAAGLRYFLVNIVHPTSAANAEMQKIGLSAFNTAGQFVGLEPVLQAIASKVTGLSDAAKADILGTLFNIRSGTAIKQLLTQIQQYEQGIKKVSSAQQMQQQLDSAVAQVMSQLGSVIHTVVSNFQDFAALVGTQVIPILSGFLSKVVGPIVVQMRQWAQDPASAQIMAHFLMLGAAISGVGLIIVGTFMSPIVAFIAIMAVVMATVVGVTLLIQNFGTVWARLEPTLQRVWGILQQIGLVLLIVGAALVGMKVAALAQAFVAMVPGIIMNIIELTQLAALYLIHIARMALMGAAAMVMALQNFPLLLSAIIADTAAWIANAAAMAIALLPYILIGVLIAGAVIGLVLLIRQFGGLNVILGVLKAAWAVILPTLQQAADAIKGALLSAIKQLQPVWQQLVAAFIQAEPALKSIGMVLGVIIMVAIGLVIGILRGLINVFVVVVVTVIKVVAGIIQAFAGVVQFFMGFFAVIRGLMTGNWAMVQQGFAQMGAGVLNIIKGLWNAVSAVFVGAFNAIKGFVTGFISGVIGFFQNLAGQLVHHSIIPDMLSAIVSAILGFGPRAISAFGNFVSGLIQKAQQLPGMIKNALGNLGNLLFSAGQSLIQGLINGLGSMIGSLLGKAGQMLTSLRNLFPHSPAKEGPLMDAHLWMPNLVHMLADTAEQAGPSLKASMGRVATGAKAGLGTGTGSGGGGGTGGETYTLTVDGKAFMSFFHNKLTGELQANGVGRLLN
jgi:TP901 family phage tail tape measure protein